MQSTSMPQGTRLSGIFAMLAAVGLFSVMDVLLKLLAQRYPLLQLASLRGASSLPFVTIWVVSSVSLSSLLRVRWRLQLLRFCLGLGMMLGFTYALRTLPLSTTYTLFFVAPLMITALSVPFLGERVGPRRWSAIAIGLVGVLVVLRPTTEGMFTWAGLSVLLSAAGYALSAITVRVLARTDSTQSLVFWLLVMFWVGAGALAAPGWVPVRSDDWPLIVALGLTGAFAQVAITEAFRRTEASVIAPLEYTALAWGVGFDALLWGVVPDRITWLGAAIIVASGLYLIRRERVHVEAEHP